MKIQKFQNSWKTQKMTKTEYYYGMIEKYNKSIHGQTNDTIYLNENTYLSLHTKHKSESICDYENQLKQYREECKERNESVPFFTLFSVYKIGDYTLAIDKTALIVKIQRKWRQFKSNFRRRYNVRSLFFRQQFTKNTSR